MLRNCASGKMSSKGPKTSAKKQKAEKKAEGSSKGKRPQSGKKDEVDLSMAAIGHPEIFPLVLTMQTQEIFNCRVDEDVTEQNRFKLIKKEDVIQDLKTRAAVSDFHAVKNVVLEYPGEELLVVFDAEFQYGQNFYLVASEEAKENLLKPPETAEENEEENGTPDIQPYKPPVSKPWVSLGSEKEVEEESVKDTVRKVKYKVSRVRRMFGAPITFTDKNASEVKDSYIECTSYQDKAFSIKVLEMMWAYRWFQKLEKLVLRRTATQYFPRQLSDEEKEENLSSEKMKDFLTSVSLRMEIALQQNEIMNAFFDDWKALGEDESSSGGKPGVFLEAHQSFPDLRYLKDTTIRCVCWHPTTDGIVAVAARRRLSYKEEVNLCDKLLLQQSAILFWSIFDPIHPQLVLECPEDIDCFQFSPSDPNIVAGGCVNGQVVLWDISQHEEKLQNVKPVDDDDKMTEVNTVKGSVLNILRYNSTSGVKNGKVSVQVNGEKWVKPSLTETQQSSTEPPLVRFCMVSSIEDSHKKTVTDLHWLPAYFEDNQMGAASENKAEICVQLVTCSPDCSILFWDIPATNLTEQPASEKAAEGIFYKPPDVSDKHLDLCWKPVVKINLCKSDINTECIPIRISLRELRYRCKTSDRRRTRNTSEALAKDSLYNRSKNQKILENLSTSLFIGTEDGKIIYSDLKMEVDGDLAKPVSKKHAQKYTFHNKSIHTLQRSPFFKDVVLSIGGRNFAIWKEEIANGAILQSSCSAARYTAGHWSLTRPGVFFLGRDDGNIDIWDLLKKTHEPSHFQKISEAMVTFISPSVASPEQHFLAVSDGLGVLHVLEICQTLRDPLKNEQADILEYFEREAKYLKNWEQEFQEYQDFQAERELKSCWKHKGRKQV